MPPRDKLTITISFLVALVTILVWSLPDDSAAPTNSALVPHNVGASAPAVGATAEAPAATVERADATPPPTEPPPPPLAQSPQANNAATQFETPAVMPVRDLVFPGPGSAPPIYASMDDLVANLKEATDPNYWRDEGVGITGEDSGYLAVKASPKMQLQVSQVLADIRRLARDRVR